MPLHTYIISIELIRRECSKTVNNKKNKKILTSEYKPGCHVNNNKHIYYRNHVKGHE